MEHKKYIAIITILNCIQWYLNCITVAFDRTAMAFNRSGATRSVALDISKDFERVWHAGLLSKLSLTKFQVRYLPLFLLFSVIDDFEWFWIKHFHKNNQLMLSFSRLYSWSYTFPTILITFLITIMLSMLMVLISTPSVTECRPQRDTVAYDRKWLVDFNAGKTQLVSFDQSKNTGAIALRIQGFVLEEK